MLNRSTIIWCLVLTFCFIGNTFSAEQRSGLIIETPKTMSVDKVETFFDNHPEADYVTWTPLKSDVTRLGLIVSRLGFERAVAFEDGNSLFYLNGISDLGLQFHKSSAFSVQLNLGTDGSGFEIYRDINNSFAVGLSAEHINARQFGSFLKKSLTLSDNAMLNSKLGYLSNGAVYISGEAVRLDQDETSELFSWINFFTENNEKSLGFGKTWFDFYDGLDQTLTVRWDSVGWTGGFLLNKEVQDGARFTIGLINIDQILKPTVFVELATSTEKIFGFSPRILLKTGKLKSQYLLRKSLKPFRRQELSRHWQEAMDFGSENY